MGKKIVKGLLMILCCGILVSCGNTTKENEETKEGPKTEIKDEFKGFVDYENNDFKIKMPEQLKEIKSGKNIIQYSGTILELEEKKTASELEKEKSDNEEKEEK